MKLADQVISLCMWRIWSRLDSGRVSSLVSSLAAWPGSLVTGGWTIWLGQCGQLECIFLAGDNCSAKRNDRNASQETFWRFSFYTSTSIWLCSCHMWMPFQARPGRAEPVRLGTGHSDTQTNRQTNQQSNAFNTSQRLTSSALTVALGPRTIPMERIAARRFDNFDLCG